MEYEKFYNFIKVDCNNVHRITIPIRLVQFMGIKQGDQVKVMIQKVPREVKNEKDTN